MDLFKFNSPTGAPWRFGEAITKPDSVMWIERYREPGEFKLSGLLGSGLRENLPIGTFISHFDTKEIMIVEDHVITDDPDEDPTIEITGRGLETILENRIVGAGLGYNDPLTFKEYSIGAANVATQAIALMAHHMLAGQVTDPNDEIPYITLTNTVPAEGQVIERVMKRQDVHKSLKELLEIYNYGIKVIRNANGTATFNVHKGADKSAKVIFSWKYGDLEGTQVLHSHRSEKNVAYVKGRYVEEFVYTPGATKMSRRVVLIDGSDIDDYLDTAPTGATLTSIRQKMFTRGEQFLRLSHPVEIARADISPTTQWQFRKDYEVGDIISIEANYGAVDVRRITEYTEIEDENGESGHPTFDVI